MVVDPSGSNLMYEFSHGGLLYPVLRLQATVMKSVVGMPSLAQSRGIEAGSSAAKDAHDPSGP
jgi:hypothetical protein